ncbi:MAG: imidazole glycerol phosphate synthase subunit HisH [SAR202 cluster bacterium]|nr:imidazole glycerol phosphate synthase subunit HisH [SAR202 cluster bacterium]
MTGKPRIVVIDHRSANIHSVAKALVRCGVEPVVSSAPEDLARADGAVLPGVGAIDAAMRALTRLELIEPIKRFVAAGRPLLCVCLGMQLLFPRSEEGREGGLGLVDGNVVRFEDGMHSAYGDGALKVPHMGWNRVHLSDDARAHPVFAGVPQESYFYFVHSYHCRPADQARIAATTDYGVSVCAALIDGEIIATQFHPEKSGVVGLRIYENFVAYVTARAAARAAG